MSGRQHARSASTPDYWTPSFLFVWLIPFVLGIAAAAPILLNGLAYDDQRVLDTTRYLVGSGSNYLMFRGLTYVSYSLDLQLWGNWIPGWHLTNIVVHGLNSLLAAMVIRVLTRSNLSALAGGALFAVHPVHVEAIASIGNRKDLLAMMAVMASLLFYLDEQHPRRGFILSLICLGFGLLAKEVAAIGLIIMSPLALYTAHSGSSAGVGTRLQKRIVVVSAIVLPIWMATWLGIPALFSSSRIQEITEGLCRNYPALLREVFGAIGDQWRLLLYPESLSADYPLKGELSRDAVYLGVLIVAVWIISIVILIRRKSVTGYGVAWILIMFLPCSNIIPLTRFFIAERYLYVPSFGICLIMGYWLRAAIHNRVKIIHTAGTVTFGLLVVCGFAGSWRGNGAWRDELTLWRTAHAAHPEGTGRIEQNLGAALLLEGDNLNAIGAFQRALRFFPGDPELLYNLSAALYNVGQNERAKTLLRGLTRVQPRHERAWPLLGACLIQTGQVDSALWAYHNALLIAPEDPQARVALAAIYLDTSSPATAVKWITSLVNDQPHLPLPHVLEGTVNLRLGDSESAEKSYREALRLDPTYLPGLVSLAWCLATAPEATPADIQEALNIAQYSNELSNGAHPLALQTLATVQARSGDQAAAASTLRYLHNLAAEIGDTAWQRRSNRQLALLHDPRRTDAQHSLPMLPFLFSGSLNDSLLNH